MTTLQLFGVLTTAYALALGAGDCYAQTTTTAKQPPTSEEVRKAKTGDAEAQFRLGVYLSTGFNFDNHGKLLNPEGEEWLRKAAKQGHAGARLRLQSLPPTDWSKFVPEKAPVQTSQGAAPVLSQAPVGRLVDLDAPLPGEGRPAEQGVGRSPGLFDDILYPEKSRSGAEGSSKSVIPLDDVQKSSDGEPAAPMRDGSMNLAGIFLTSGLLSALCLWGAVRLLRGAVKGSSPLATGLRWSGWSLIGLTTSILMKVFSQLIGGFGMPWFDLTIGVIGAISFALLALCAGSLWAFVRRRGSGSISSSIGRSSQSHGVDKLPSDSLERSEMQFSNGSDEELWAEAAAEFESDDRRPGLWAMVFSDADGNEALAKAKYLRTRATQLKVAREARS